MLIAYDFVKRDGFFAGRFYGKSTILEVYGNERIVRLAIAYTAIALTTMPPVVTAGVLIVRNSPMMLAYHVLKQKDWYCYNENLLAYGLLQVFDWFFALIAGAVGALVIYALGEQLLYGSYIVKTVG